MRFRLRYSMRSLMIVITVVSVLAPWLPALAARFDEVTTYRILIVLAPAAIVSMAWLAGMLAFHSRGRWAGTLLAKLIFGAFLAFAAIPTIYLMWARYRWGNYWTDEINRDWPYPDQLLWAFHDWLDRRHPAPGWLKIHGEYYEVWRALDRSVLAAMTVCGFLLGGLAPGLATRIYRMADRCRRGVQSLFRLLRMRKRRPIQIHQSDEQ